MTAEQLTWFLKGWVAGKGAGAAQPPSAHEWRDLVNTILMAETSVRRTGGCGCGGAGHGR